MKKYSIREVEKLTGIKAHTIRIWEKRYKLTCCQRTETNIRYYSDEELKRLINIAFLIDNGSKISRIALLDHEQLCEEISRLVSQQSAPRHFIDRFVKAMVDLDEAQFHQTLNECVDKFGFPETMIKVIYPFLDRVGVLWQTNQVCPVREHFVSHLIRQKVMAETDKLEYKTGKGQTFLLFLPVDELHELGLLFYNYYLRQHGYKVYYFGQSVPFNDLDRALKSVEAHALLTYFVSGKTSDEIQRYLTQLESVFKGQRIYVTGMQCQEISFNGLSKCVRVENVHDFARHL